MRLRGLGVRTSLAALTLLGTGTAGLYNATTVTAQDADAYVFSAIVSTTGGGSIVPPPTLTYTFNSGACKARPLPSPISTSLPGYVDASGNDSGECSAVTGGGTIEGELCDSGVITANWNLTEPSGDTAVFDGDGVIIGGVAVIAAPPVAVLGTGYWDGSATPGAAVSVALFEPGLTAPCLAPMHVDAAVLAAY